MSEPAGGVLLDVGDGDAEPLPVADRRADLGAGLGRDHHADVADPRLRQRLDPVEEDRLVRDGHELLRARVGQWPQTGAAAPGQDQALEVPHQ